jgi:hypothetical protein
LLGLVFTFFQVNTVAAQNGMQCGKDNASSCSPAEIADWNNAADATAMTEGGDRHLAAPTGTAPAPGAAAGAAGHAANSCMSQNLTGSDLDNCMVNQRKNCMDQGLTGSAMDVCLGN